jgi:hypothetical protein
LRKNSEKFNCDSLTLDVALSRLQSKVESLSRRKNAALFGCIGTGLMPLYTQFSERYHWGSPSVLSDALESSLGFALGKSVHNNVPKDVLIAISRITPSEEEFEVPESTFAMDVAICADAAVRSTDADSTFDPAWIEYALNPVTTIVCEKHTGYLDLGSSPEADFWRSNALKDPDLKHAYEAAEEMIGLLSDAEIALSEGLIDKLKKLALGLVPPSYLSSAVGSRRD